LDYVVSILEQPLDLQALTDFNLVAVHGGFGRASRMSGRAKATLSRRVAELEQSLGARLIERGGHTLRLTEEGRTLHERTQGLLSEIAEAGEAIALGASTPRGRLRVSAPTLFAHVALGRIGARFALAYPEVGLEIVAEDRRVDPVDDGYDLVIRVDPAPDQLLVGRPFLRDERLIVASPEVGRPARPKGGAKEIPVRAVLMISTRPDVVWQMRSENRATVHLRPKPVLRLSSLSMVRDAVLAGAGAALLPKMLVADDIASGRLVQWGKQEGPAVEIWALHSSRRLVGAKVRAFLEVLEQAFPTKIFSPLR
jgi:DNA-binding transcriptional LysR family regulator